MVTANFWAGRSVLLTGHTGFKGAWAGVWLASLGARVHGLALAPETEPNLHDLLSSSHLASDVIGDIRDPRVVADAIERAAPDIVVHMAAQALVRRSYRDPVTTFDTNVLGTVHLLEALRETPGVKCVLVVTSDKVYENRDDGHRFTEGDHLGGADPYSASKAAAEIITACYAKSYFAPRVVPVATARAGNVIGGGDWSEDRLLPDVWRALEASRTVELRHPQSTRPWQHVLEPLSGYLTYIEQLCADPQGHLPHAINFGPRDERPITVAEIADTLNGALGVKAGWRQAPGEHPPEKATLAINAGLAHRALKWRARLSAAEAVQWTADWYKAHKEGSDMRAFTLRQIRDYATRKT
ncbi:MAG: CDP-glucose 4,6-dehydratase [Hyphomicrobium sp.]|uniref:CDP-glucose 4,6-dehydratase n=1 Tax=Hyphomicrobium sp. TaxID=82 RepID=UPI001328E746|nr:CDP-glucose 4,6-dehydratase [Hyphomicrobium sp.]KAB2938997.1 MAG: CDP-glucose 4,6-dehydratase [Hyphomicrobium sp.]MBZ0211777.1 CDP-glucose 4,6-dehydratase [Hyphomicrobium sp.]